MNPTFRCLFGRRGLFVVIASVCLLSWAEAPTRAQGAAGIVGQVKDESGGVLPGVTVTATSPALQVQSVSDVANERGEYRLQPLPIGTYTVEYSLQGFQTIRQTNVRMELGVQAKVDVVMKLGAVAETVTVTGATPVVEVTSTAASTRFTLETLELTPTSRNGIISLGAQTPGVKGRVDIGGGTVGDPPEFQAFGQTWESANVIEGVNTAGHSESAYGGNYFDYTAFQEVRAQSFNNGPDIASHGVAITILVKSGGNTFHGSGAYGYMSDGLQSNNVDDTLKAQGITLGNPLNKRTDLGGDIGGRIVRDKLWFYQAGRYRTQDKVQLGALKPDGSPANGYLSEILSNSKLSYQANAANRLVFWYQEGRKYQTATNVSQFIPWESRNDSANLTYTWKGEWQATRNRSTLSVLFGKWGWYSQSIGTTNVKHDAGGDIPGGLNVTLNNPENYAGFAPQTTDLVTLRQSGQGGPGYNDFGHYETRADFSHYLPNTRTGNHEFKVGFDYSPYFNIQTMGDRGALGQYQLIFSSGVANQIRFYNAPTYPEADVNYTSAYGNDTWTIGRKLTLNLGVRYARDNPSVPKQCRPASPWPFAPAACTNEIQMEIYSTFAPRLFFSLDATGDGKNVIKGGWGRFDRTRLYNEVFALNPFQVATSTYRWRDLNGNRNYNAGEVNLDPNGPDFVSTAGTVGVTGSLPGAVSVNNNEKRPGSDQFSLSYERQLGQDFGVRVTGIYIHTFQENRYLNVLRPPSAFTIPVTNADPGPDGRVGTADDPGTFVTYYEYPLALAGRANESYIISNDPNADETHKAVDLQVQKRISNRWQFLAGYTATKNDIKLPRPSDSFFGTLPARTTTQWDPNVTINTRNQTWDWSAKVSGIYMFPWDINASANLDIESGPPQARQVLVTGGRTIPNLVVNAEPFGSLRLPATKVLDVRFDKSFPIGGTHKIKLRVNFYNALNANTVLSRTIRSGASYLIPTAILSPRIVEFGAQYSF